MSLLRPLLPAHGAAGSNEFLKIICTQRPTVLPKMSSWMTKETLFTSKRWLELFSWWPASLFYIIYFNCECWPDRLLWDYIQHIIKLPWWWWWYFCTATKGFSFEFILTSRRAISIHPDPYQALTSFTQKLTKKNYRKWKWEQHIRVQQSKILIVCIQTKSTKSLTSGQEYPMPH